MKKLYVCALASMAFAAILALPACSKKDNSAAQDSANIEVAETQVIDDNTLPVAQSSEYFAIFSDDSKKSEVASDTTYAVTASGIKYLTLRDGKGAKPSPQDMVMVNYSGQFTNGEVFDSSYLNGQPATFPLNKVIKGWTEGLQLMQEGGKAVFYIPYELAYGEMGNGPIPPKSDLIFEVELIKVNP